MLVAMAVMPCLGFADQIPDRVVRRACKADVESFCPNMKDPVKIMECLQDHEKQLSADCASGLHDCPMYNCIDDIKKFCPDANGTKETLVCLWKHRAELSDKCWNQSIGQTKIGHLPETHACRADEQEYCSKEDSLLGTMNCLRQPKLKRALSAPCSRIVENCRLFACVPEAQRMCPDITTMRDLKGCITQHNLQCAPQVNPGQTQAESKSQFFACEQESQQYCADVPPESMYECLHDREDSISKQCKKSLKDSLEHRCKQERISFCTDKSGQDLKACLYQVKSVSMKCQRALAMANVAPSEIHENQFSTEMEPTHEVSGFNILLTCLATVSFLVMLLGLAFVVRKSRSASLSLDSLPSATTSTEYVRI